MASEKVRPETTPVSGSAGGADSPRHRGQENRALPQFNAARVPSTLTSTGFGRQGPRDIGSRRPGSGNAFPGWRSPRAPGPPRKPLGRSPKWSRPSSVSGGRHTSQYGRRRATRQILGDRRPHPRSHHRIIGISNRSGQQSSLYDRRCPRHPGKEPAESICQRIPGQRHPDRNRSC